MGVWVRCEGEKQVKMKLILKVEKNVYSSSQLTQNPERPTRGIIFYRGTKKSITADERPITAKTNYRGTKKSITADERPITAKTIYRGRFFQNRTKCILIFTKFQFLTCDFLLQKNNL